jgi:cysteinyl-tRNA synthetase
MTIRLYNTKIQKVEEFIPRKIGEASLYLCGLTTYDHAHVGHARTNIVFDILARHLRQRNLKVTYVRNVTDVDDKILKRASEQNKDVLEFSNEMATICKEELLSVGCENPDHEPHVSKHMKEIIQFVEKLIEMKFAYVVEKEEGKDVYFHVRSFSDYGKLSKRNIDDLISGARIDASEIKKDPLDFALWKGSKDVWGWESPWGKGRPGWHIECSAMSHALLGEHFDIHAGGMDLIFPHHENEIAQSEAIFGSEMANFWMHSGFLVVDKEKMSKSLGNFVTIQQVLENNDQEALRYFLLNSHYRSPLNFEINVENEKVSFPSINEAERKIDYFYSTLELAKN